MEKLISKLDKQTVEELTPAKLVKLLKHLSDAYYNTGESLVTDEMFDMIRDRLLEIDPKNKYFDSVGAPVNKQDAVKLPFPMMSLNKIKTDAQLTAWLVDHKGPYIMMDKLDGVSAMFYGGKLYTRGDGIEGQDISHLIPYVIKDVDLNKVTAAVRGELIISRRGFEPFVGVHSNARNSVSGFVNSKTISKELSLVVRFVAYAVVYPTLKISDQLKLLEKHKFEVVNYTKTKKLSHELLSERLLDRRSNSEYEVDGVVVQEDLPHEVTTDNPTYAFAFKIVMADQVAEAEVIEVLWEVSRHGLIKPKVHIKPVTLVGVTIEYATAFNALFVVENQLGPGAKIKLIRSGDVIPHISEVITPAATAQLPAIPYNWNKSGVDLVVADTTDNKDITAKNIAYFFEKIGVKHTALATVTKLVDNGYDSIFDILTAEIDDLVKINGVGRTSMTKMKAAVVTAMSEVGLHDLMAASGMFGAGFGATKCKIVVDAYPDIMLSTWSSEEFVEKLLALDGFAELSAKSFADKFPEFAGWFVKLAEIYDLSRFTKVTVKVEKKAGVFNNMSIVLTGFRDATMEKFIEDNGGRVKSSVSKNTNLVVYVETDPVSSKYTKAVELKIPMLTRDAFNQKYRA